MSSGLFTLVQKSRQLEYLFEFNFLSFFFASRNFKKFLSLDDIIPVLKKSPKPFHSFL
tara:strand:+ start:304 stop:477 length:174 start_codon:yes stop_codon:yes gene_type:complete